jgi:transposase-like protein
MDGIWVTVMKPTGEQKKDKKGRNRKVKTGKRIPILVAQGVWPASGRQEVIGWVIAAGETQEGWEDLAFQLRQKGVYLEDIQLLIADGSSGLEALLQKKYPEVPFQRCIFHKLKNLWRALKEPEGLDRQQIRDYKLNFVQKAAHIWDADDECEATQRLRAFVQKWQDCQPKATAILNDGFDLTVTYYRVMEQAAQKGELWPVQLLRTTSQLERENRCIRRRMDAAVLFHSEIGLSASLYLNQIFYQSMRSSPMPGNWSQQIEQQIAEAKCFLS